MVAEFGMGVALDADGAPPIALPTGDYALSDRTRRDVDLAAMTLAREAHRRARALLPANRDCLDDLAATHWSARRSPGRTSTRSSPRTTCVRRSCRHPSRPRSVLSSEGTQPE